MNCIDILNIVFFKFQKSSQILDLRSAIKIRHQTEQTTSHLPILLWHFCRWLCQNWEAVRNTELCAGMSTKYGRLVGSFLWGEKLLGVWPRWGHRQAEDCPRYERNWWGNYVLCGNLHVIYWPQKGGRDWIYFREMKK